jgi:hypothetical protein
MSAEPRCKGWLLTGVAAYLEPEQRAKLAELAGPELRAFLAQTESRRDDWIPVQWIIEALILSDRIVGTGDLSVAWRIGRFVASREVGIVQQLALRVLRPAVIMSLSSGLWVTHYRNAGRVGARGVSDRDMIITFSDVPEKSRALCLSIGGWIEGFLALGPRTNIVVRHGACMSEGASACEFRVTWDE